MVVGLLAIAIALGLLLRGLNLDAKVFWHDEVFTALRVVGYSGPQVEARVFTGQPITAGELLQFQTFPPEAGLGKTLASLAEHPEHPPLYYLLNWAWVHLWGTSITAFRSLSVLFSVLTLPVIAGLSWELLGDRPSTGIAVALLAVSPVHLLYAQEAREYSLWVLTVGLASAALLRALRQRRWRAWGLYAVTLALGSYTSLLTALVAIAHGLYGVGEMPRRQWGRLGTALGGALLLFAPWLILMAMKLARLQSVTDWANTRPPWRDLLSLWGLHFSALFVDPGLPLDHPYTVCVPPLVLVLIAVALYRLWRTQPHRVSGFLLTLTLVPTLALMGADLLRGSQISVHTRYFFPALLGAQLAVAAWLGQRWCQRPRRALAAVTGLCLLGLASGSLSATADTWWNKGLSYHNAAIAQYLQTLPAPLLLSQNAGTTLGDVISLSHRLPSTTPFQLTPNDRPPRPTVTASDVFLVKPPPSLLDQAVTVYPCPPEPVAVVDYGLWRLPCLDLSNGE